MDTKRCTPYVSCIKLNGKPILPPIINPHLRKELHTYKQQAIKLETRLKNCRELKRNLDELMTLKPLIERPLSQLTFGDNSHIEALGISGTASSTCHVNDISKNNLNPHFKLKSPQKKNINFQKDIVEVTEYVDNRVNVILDQFSKSTETSFKDNLVANIVNLEETNSVSNEVETESSIEISIEESVQSKPIIKKYNSPEGSLSGKPHLIRSNSYTLDEELIQNKSKNKKYSSPERISSPGKPRLIRSNSYTLDEDSIRNKSMNKKYSPEGSSPGKPRLIRSNSYTLDTPSPILLAHLHKNKFDIADLPLTRAWCSVENNSTPTSSEEFSSINTVFDQKTMSPGNNTENIAEIRPNVKPPTIEVFQTDISVQQITVNTNKSNDSGESLEQKATFFMKDPLYMFEPDSEFMKVLKDIPENYAKQIIELLKKQHFEKQERLERNDNLSNRIMLKKDENTNHRSSERHKIDIKENQRINENSCDDPPQKNLSGKKNCDSLSLATELYCNKEDSRIRRSSTFSMSPSQSIYYSVSDSSNTITPLSTPTTKLDVETRVETNRGDDRSEMSDRSVRSYLNGTNEPVKLLKNISNGCKNNRNVVENLHLQCSPNVSVSRELFPVPKIDEKTMNALRREWAASVIGAHVKGFLTRRLLKTEKVQGIIETIKDALTCALELHKADNIDEKDVELHRRLIQQVSAACYAFHEVFFDLSILDRMQIISLDRQRKLEKINRPQSAPRSFRSNISNSSRRSVSSSRSSSKSKLDTLRQPQSLTKV